MKIKFDIKYLKFILILGLGFLESQCKHEAKVEVEIHPKNEVKYAGGFSIYSFENFHKLTLHRAYAGDTQSIDYYLIDRQLPLPDSLQNKRIILTPVQQIVVTNTSHIPMLEALQATSTLIGFPNTSYISSPHTQVLIEKGQVHELGNEQDMNIEILLHIKPELVVGFGVDHPSKMYENIERMGIPVLMNADWMEETPLGRAEWIKFFGVLYGKSKEANLIFDSIERNYNQLKVLAQKSTDKPKVLSGSLFQDVWYTAAGESFLAQMIHDAHAQYLWADTKGNGSLNLSLESVLAKGQKADYWIAPGDFLTQQSFAEVNPMYLKFKALTQGKTYTYAHQKGKNGGILYFESSPLHPDWVLEDFIRIFHPELLNESDFHFFKVVE
jgi:iron complex transport system substrate-binding protein